jgi:hypothetical protein
MYYPYRAIASPIHEDLERWLVHKPFSSLSRLEKSKQISMVPLPPKRV